MTGSCRQAPRHSTLCSLAPVSAPWFLSICLSLGPVTALALDGSVNARRSIQTGVTGSEEYRQNQTIAEATASQRVPLTAGLHLRFDGSASRERFDSEFGGVSNALDRRIGQGNASLNYHKKAGSFSLSASGFDQMTDGTGLDRDRVERGQVRGSGDFRRGRVRLGTSVLYTASRHGPETGARTKEQDLSGWASARSGIPKLGEIGYRFSGLSTRDLTRNTSSRQLTHTVDYSGMARFAGGRGQVSLKTNHSFLDTVQEWTQASQVAGLHLPLFVRLRLDDTPAVNDPLEGEGVDVPELYDGNRQNATDVRIGDTASPVREIGGDYRNIEADFGEPVDIVSATLYVDRVLLAPEMFSWLVFTSNDPEGRAWEEVSGARAAYVELGTGLQGWSVLLPQAVSARFLKLVDVKLGPSVPELSVTELEVFTLSNETAQRAESETATHKANLSLGYRITSSLRAGYDLYYRRRTREGTSGYLEDNNHTMSGAWDHGLWTVSGRYELRTMGRDARSTDLDHQMVSVRRGKADRFSTTLSFSRSHDQSGGIEKTYHNLSAGIGWPAAPSLRIDQQVTGTKLLDRGADLESNSLTLRTMVTAEVIPGLSLDLNMNQRWVSREAGAGFSRYEDVTLDVGWRPVPLVAFQSSIRYELRDQSDWLTRNSLTWEPFPAGDLKLGFGVHHYRDTRVNETQRGGGMQFDWRALPSLTFAGSVDAVRLKMPSYENAPVNSELRVTWRF